GCGEVRRARHGSARGGGPRGGWPSSRDRGLLLAAGADGSTGGGRSSALGCVTLDLLLEQLLHPGPVVVDDGVPGRVADRVGEDHVLSEDPLERRADAEQRAAYAQVARVGLELDPHRAPALEGVAE